MEWRNQENQQQEQYVEVQEMEGQYRNGVYVKVMTNEQMEQLRKQISVYATICERLVEMHKAISAQQDLSGMRLGNPYCDPLVPYAAHKITSRQRWTPTPIQLQILEHIYDQGNGTPSKQRISEITTEMSQHGPISETNVYNWFQNRRARSKRKQMVQIPNNSESKAEETELESSKDKKTKPEESIQSFENSGLRVESIFFPSPDLGIDHLFGKMEVPGSLSPYCQLERYNMVG